MKKQETKSRYHFVLLYIWSGFQNEKFMLFTGSRFIATHFSQVFGFLLLSFIMGFLYSRTLPDGMNYSYWIHSMIMGFLITLSFHAGRRKS